MSDAADFTEAGYRGIVVEAKRRWRFLTYAETTDAERGCLWRHDIDFSVHRALRLATIEAEESVRATYFVLLHSSFYNALEPEVAARIREIAGFGHDLAIHIDPASYAGRIRDIAGLADALRLEQR